MDLLEQETNINLSQISYKLIKEDNFTITLYKNGSTIMIF